MVQIEKQKKKKGRPSKEDLEARRNGGGAESPASLTAEEKCEVRRSLRRKSFRYNIIDYDEDYLDEDDDEFFEEKDEDVDDDDDEVFRREKKVKLVVKLNSGSGGEGGERKEGRDSENRPGRRGRVSASRGEDDEVEEEREREVKKRRINGRRADDEDEDGDVENGGIDLDDEVVRFGFNFDFWRSDAENSTVVCVETVSERLRRGIVQLIRI